jgi:integration host factor subunit beta
MRHSRIPPGDRPASLLDPSHFFRTDSLEKAAEPAAAVTFSLDINLCALYSCYHSRAAKPGRGAPQEKGTVTKKEIVRQIAERIEETQLKTKEIVQLTFDAIIDTLITSKSRRIELRNFGVFEVKLRKGRKARNPRSNAPVNVPPKYVVTFKPGKEMEERVRKLIPTAEELAALERRPAKAASGAGNGTSESPDGQAVPRKKRHRKPAQAQAAAQ